MDNILVEPTKYLCKYTYLENGSLEHILRGELKEIKIAYSKIPSTLFYVLLKQRYIMDLENFI